jgi:uncharacterized LabA/DUF88 family protein
MADRVAVFLDYQNIWHGARDAFFRGPAVPSPFGNVDPAQLGRMLASRTPGRVLADVRVYQGMPSSVRDPRSYGASRRRGMAWQSAGATVVTNPLRYPPGWPRVPAQEKGTDVALAVDFVVMALSGLYDVGILMSADTDLLPALQAVAAVNGNRRPRCEVAAWLPPGGKASQLRLATVRLWCHYLDMDDYKGVADLTRYAS